MVSVYYIDSLRFLLFVTTIPYRNVFILNTCYYSYDYYIDVR